jgi:long-chain acyl-CoA synthetase
MSENNKRPWIKNYKLGPYALADTMAPYPVVSLSTIFDETASKYAKRAACEYLGKKYTWEELKNMVDRLASALAGLGIVKGDRVATILPTSPQFIISDYAILRAGAVHVPCSPLHRSRELAYEIGQSGAKILICLEESLDLVGAIRDKTILEHIIVTNVQDFSAEEPAVKEIPGALQLRKVIADHEPMRAAVSVNPKEDLAELVFTGGATGVPKGVMLTHHNLVTNTIQALPWVLKPLDKGIIGKASMLIGIPTFHSYGHWTIRASVFWGLQMLLLPDSRDTDTIVHFLKKYRPFMAPLVPTQYMRLVEKKIGRTNTTFTSGAAPLPEKVRADFKKETGMPITEAYGLTETSPVTHFNVSSFSKITGFMPFEKVGSIGVPVVDTDARVVDNATGKDLGPGEVGELYVSGPQVMLGYWPTPGSGLTDGWLKTGDLCRMDDDGYFFLVDRDKDMVNVSGNKVYTTLVDTVLFEHASVASAVAIGVPDPERDGSERIKAFVVLKDSCKGTVTEADIIEHCRQNLAPYAVPRTVEFRNSLPMTVTEKLFKKQLRDEEMRKQQEMKG